ncbi:hypothetical protein Dimus_002569, partial [Dionaea muscipula]
GLESGCVGDKMVSSGDAEVVQGGGGDRGSSVSIGVGLGGMGNSSVEYREIKTL